MEEAERLCDRVAIIDHGRIIDIGAPAELAGPIAGEVISSLRVADTGIMLVNSITGVEVGTDIIWEYTERFKTPMIFCINKLDDDNADYEKTVREIKIISAIRK